MFVVPALKVRQFSQEFFLLNLAAGDVERMVRFEVLGDTAVPGRTARKPRFTLVNWAEIETRVQTSDEAYQRPILRKKIDELAAHYLRCREDEQVPAVPGAVLLTTDEPVEFTPDRPAAWWRWGQRWPHMMSARSRRCCRRHVPAS